MGVGAKFGQNRVDGTVVVERDHGLISWNYEHIFCFWKDNSINTSDSKWSKRSKNE